MKNRLNKFSHKDRDRKKVTRVSLTGEGGRAPTYADAILTFRRRRHERQATTAATEARAPRLLTVRSTFDFSIWKFANYRIHSKGTHRVA